MKVKYKFLFLIFIFCFITIFESEAQRRRGFRRPTDSKIFVSGGIGANTYFGDLTDGATISDPNVNFSLGVGYALNPRIDVRAELSYFRLEGDDADADRDDFINRNLSFRTDLVELAVTGVVHLYERPSRFFTISRFNPYAFAGIGVAFFNPTTETDDGERVSLPDLRTEGVDYSQLTFVIPFGVGVKYHVTNQLSIGFEAGARIAFTDYLDDVSTNFPGAEFFGDNELAASLSDRNLGGPASAGDIRGNSDVDDFYGFLGLKAVYRFGSDNRRPASRALRFSNKNNKRTLQKRRPIRKGGARKGGLFGKRRR